MTVSAGSRKMGNSTATSIAISRGNREDFNHRIASKIDEQIAETALQADCTFLREKRHFYECHATDAHGLKVSGGAGDCPGLFLGEFRRFKAPAEINVRIQKQSHSGLDFFVGFKRVPKMRGIEIDNISDDLAFIGPGPGQVFPGLADGRGHLGDRLSAAGDDDRLVAFGDLVDEGETPGLEFGGSDGARLHTFMIPGRWTVVRIKGEFTKCR